MLENLREVIAFAREDTEGFVRQAMSNRMAAQMQEQTQAKRTLEQQERRITEIDGIIKRLYEDNINGKLTDERFSKMSADYEREQAGLQASVEELRESGELKNLKGLLYFTDGDGIYPSEQPEYETAFVFLNEALKKGKPPAWAHSLTLDLCEETTT